MPIGAEIPLLLFLIACSAYFSSAETAITSLTRGRLRYLINTHDKKRAALTHLMEEPNSLITALLLMNNLVNVAASSLMTLIVITSMPHLPDYATGLVATGVMTISLLIFAEITPKNFAKHNPERFTLASINQIHALARALRPFIRLFRALATGLLRILGEDLSKQEEVQVSDEQIETLIDASEESGLLDAQDGEMIRRILDFDDMTAEQLMVPRTDVQVLELETSPAEARRLAAQNGYSRFPVYEGVPDNVVGILYAKDLLGDIDESRTDLKELLHQVYYAPVTRPINLLLREFQRRRVHMAIVLDEYGGMAGIVTMEDILEEIVGEIEDEYDQPAAQVKRISPTEAIVDGDTPVHDLNRTMDLELPEDQGVTVSGLILHCLGAMPVRGDEVELDSVRLTVEAATEKEIESIRVSISPTPLEDSPSDD